MATTLPTNTAHPLLIEAATATTHQNNHIALEQAHFKRYTASASAIARHATDEATSNQPTYRITPNSGWEYLGPHEWDTVRAQAGHDDTCFTITLPDLQHLLQGSPAHVRDAASREKTRDAAYEQTWAAIRRIHPMEGPTPIHPSRYTALVAAAEKAADLVAVALATGVANNLITWDTAETLAEGGLRLARDAAYRMRATNRPAIPAKVFAETLDMIGWVDRPPADYARNYLEHKQTIDAAVSAANIEWGMPTVAGDEAARIASISASGWRSHVAREEAPPKDAGKGWRRSTVLAWSLARARAGRADGWE